MKASNTMNLGDDNETLQEMVNLYIETIKLYNKVRADKAHTETTKNDFLYMIHDAEELLRKILKEKGYPIDIATDGNFEHSKDWILTDISQLFSLTRN